MTKRIRNHIFGVLVFGLLVSGHYFLEAQSPKQVSSIPGYRFLGWEGETVNVPHKSNIAYGADDSFVILYGVTGTVNIDNSFFTDPKPGAPKAAYYRLVSDISDSDRDQGPDGYYLMGKEGENFNIRKPVDLAYGYDGTFTFKEAVTGEFSSTNSFFGKDPVPGIPKKVWFRSPRIISRLATADPSAREMVVIEPAKQGRIVASTNPALPRAYRFQEYQFPENNGQVAYRGESNPSAEIKKIYLAQTHVMEPGYTFFFLVPDRPALLEAVVTGHGASPDVWVRGSLNGRDLGILYMEGPGTLQASVNTSQHRFFDRFTVTLPSSWLQKGLSLKIGAGNARKSYGPAELNIGDPAELNLIMVPMDILDYNEGKPDVPVPDNFLANFAGAIPASRIRLGTFPARMSLPRLAVTDGSVQPVVLTTGSDTKGVHDGNINAAALRFIHALKYATGDFAWAYYYGNTENFFPGGWGGGKAFVGADYAGVFLHEMGHGLSLPHWGNHYRKPNIDEWTYWYPYGGTGSDGGGRGPSWGFYQNSHEYVSPLIQIGPAGKLGTERSDAMQRNNHAPELRIDGPGLWDGFGDFSAIAMYRFMTGVKERFSGIIQNRGRKESFNLPEQQGYPILRQDNRGQRVLQRDNPDLPPQSWELYDFYVPQKWDTPVYTVYGSYHPKYNQANILYEPMSYRGNLPALLDPTDPATFQDLAAGSNGPYSNHFWWEKDLTFRFVYKDGSVIHALYPYNGVSRNWEPADHPWRWDMLYFALSIPADKPLARIELYYRPFVVRHSYMEDEGNIANPDLGIRADNFMDGAKLIMSRDVTTLPPR